MPTTIRVHFSPDSSNFTNSPIPSPYFCSLNISRVSLVETRRFPCGMIDLFSRSQRWNIVDRPSRLSRSPSSSQGYFSSWQHVRSLRLTYVSLPSTTSLFSLGRTPSARLRSFVSTTLAKITRTVKTLVTRADEGPVMKPLEPEEHTEPGEPWYPDDEYFRTSSVAFPRQGSFSSRIMTRFSIRV